MKKIGIFIVMLLIMTGCGNKVYENIENNGNNKKDDSKLEVKVDDLDIVLNMTGSFNGINFKYPSSMMTSNLGVYSIMDYMNGSEFIFRIAMYFFDNKSISEVMANSSVSSVGTKNINGKNWNVYEGTTQDGKGTINYAYQHNNDTYTITFIFDKNIDNFIDTFMKTVEFKKD